MIIPEKKRAVAMILSQKHKEPHMSEGGSVPEDSAMSPHLEAKAAHAASMIGALHNKDPHAMVEAMDNFLREHELHQEEDKEEESDYSPSK